MEEIGSGSPRKMHAERKTLGVVSMLFTPDPEVGALRVGKLSQWLIRDHGWQVQIVKRASSNISHQAEVNRCENIKVQSIKSYDSLTPIHWARRFQRSSVRSVKAADEPRANSLPREAVDRQLHKRGFLAELSDLLVVPDNEQMWALNAYRHLRRPVRTKQISILLSSGPPHTAHLAAYWCKRRYGLPWVLDLRDPWCGNPYGLQISSVANRVNEKLERLCFELADRILANTEPARQLILDRYPNFTDDKVVTLPNGIDEEDYAGLHPAPLWPATGRPVFIHAGSLYAKRDPTMLVHALAKLKALATQNIPLVVFVGNWEPALLQSAEKLIGQYNLRDDVLIYPALPRRNSLEAQMAADALILIGDSEESQLQIPAKLFESLYLAMPVLSLFKDDSPVNEYLKKYCQWFTQSQPAHLDGIAAAIVNLCNSIRASKDKPVSSEPVQPLQELSRRRQANQLHAILESLLGRRDGLHN